MCAETFNRTIVELKYFIASSSTWLIILLIVLS